MPDLIHPSTPTYSVDQFIQDLVNLLVGREQVVSISSGTLPEVTAIAQRLLDLLINPLPREFLSRSRRATTTPRRSVSKRSPKHSGSTSRSLRCKQSVS